MALFEKKIIACDCKRKSVTIEIIYSSISDVTCTITNGLLHKCDI